MYLNIFIHDKLISLMPFFLNACKLIINKIIQNISIKVNMFIQIENHIFDNIVNVRYPNNHKNIHRNNAYIQIYKLMVMVKLF